MTAITSKLTDPITKATYDVKVTVSTNWLEIEIEGHGTKTGDPGEVVALEVHDGEASVHVWSDITDESPTYSIALDGARERYRQPEAKDAVV